MNISFMRIGYSVQNTADILTFISVYRLILCTSTRKDILLLNFYRSCSQTARSSRTTHIPELIHDTRTSMFSCTEDNKYLRRTQGYVISIS